MAPIPLYHTGYDHIIFFWLRTGPQLQHRHQLSVNVPGDRAALAGHGIDVFVVVEIDSIQSMIGERDNLLNFAHIARIGEQAGRIVINRGGPFGQIVHADAHMACMCFNACRRIWCCRGERGMQGGRADIAFAQ